MKRSQQHVSKSIVLSSTHRRLLVRRKSMKPIRSSGQTLRRSPIATKRGHKPNRCRLLTWKFRGSGGLLIRQTGKKAEFDELRFPLVSLFKLGQGIIAGPGCR